MSLPLPSIQRLKCLDARPLAMNGQPRESLPLGMYDITNRGSTSGLDGTTGTRFGQSASRTGVTRTSRLTPIRPMYCNHFPCSLTLAASLCSRRSTQRPRELEIRSGNSSRSFSSAVTCGDIGNMSHTRFVSRPPRDGLLETHISLATAKLCVRADVVGFGILESIFVPVRVFASFESISGIRTGKCAHISNQR